MTFRPRLVASTSPAVPDEAAAPSSPDLLFRRYARYVAAIGLRLLGRSDEVDDLVQDVFVDALRGLGSLRDPEAVRSWLATITVRRVRKRLRLRRLRDLLSFDSSESSTVADRHAGPETHAVLAQLFRRLDRLPANHRLAWSLRYLENEPLERVATLCECSLATAKRRIAAATVKLEQEGDDA